METLSNGRQIVRQSRREGKPENYSFINVREHLQRGARFSYCN